MYQESSSDVITYTSEDTSNDDNICSICLVNNATEFTECAHRFCIECLRLLNTCPICRTRFTDEFIAHYHINDVNDHNIINNNQNIIDNNLINNQNIDNNIYNIYALNNLINNQNVENYDRNIIINYLRSRLNNIRDLVNYNVSNFIINDVELRLYIEIVMLIVEIERNIRNNRYDNQLMNQLNILNNNNAHHGIINDLFEVLRIMQIILP